MRPSSPWWASSVKLLPLTLGILTLVCMSPAIAQEKLLRTLTVTGRGSEMVQTSIAQVRLGVEVQGKSAQEVQAEVARRSSAVVDLLKSRRVDKLETTGISLTPVYNYSNDTRTLEGYAGTNIVSFKVPTEQAGALMDDAVKAGATRIDGVSFEAAEPAMDNARKTALQEATQDAREQADTVLAALGLRSQEIVNIQVDQAVPPPPMPLAYARDAKLANESMPVMGGEQEVQASVTLQISY
ncbi:SIMPL domain-containing protein [Geitlerinema sp. PCC 7407]|uniref:SIMPL domain-containing protein n=1 Tax=Geitlerinema sp. PCC 7407 TaxID=1173025 RepID=UPI00029F9358|nr:protein of unknown function DUF541 [Geitlerinema sp. PCC 7407]